MAQFDMACHSCGDITEITAPFGVSPTATCEHCGQPMKQYFSKYKGVRLNLGYREQNYHNQTDRDIAKFQFEHL